MTVLSDIWLLLKSNVWTHKSRGGLKTVLMYSMLTHTHTIFNYEFIMSPLENCKQHPDVREHFRYICWFTQPCILACCLSTSCTCRESSVQKHGAAGGSSFPLQWNAIFYYCWHTVCQIPLTTLLQDIELRGCRDSYQLPPSVFIWYGAGVLLHTYLVISTDFMVSMGLE